MRLRSREGRRGWMSGLKSYIVVREYGMGGIGTIER